MTETAPLTGAQVMEIRKQYHLGRREFAELCGFPTATRITNIENKESWKAGDREAVTAAVARLQADPPKGKRGRLKGETPEERIDRLEGKLRAGGKLLRENEGSAPAFFDEEQLNPDGAGWSPEPEPAGVIEGQQTPAEVIQRGTDVHTPDLRLVSNSEVATWNRCRRKWWLAWYRRLVLAQQDFMGPRAIGNRVHRALAAYYVPEGTEPVDPRDALERAIVEDWTAMAEQARRRAIPGDEEQALTDMAAKFNDAVSLERAMIEGYMEWIAEGGQDSNLKITAPETAITAQLITDVDGEKVPFTAVALLDVRAHRVTDGVRVFVDHKTVGNFTEPRKILHMDPQMLHYHLLEWLNSAAGDERCDAALYNMLRKVKRTAQAKPPFYERIEVHHNEIELRAYHQRLIGATADMIRTERRLAAGLDHHVVAYPTPDRTCSWSCDFFPICPMFDDGSRVEDAINSLYEVGDPMARYDTKIEGLGS